MGIEANFISVPEYDNLSLVLSGTYTTPTFFTSASAGQYGQSSTSNTINHNLGFNPIMLIYIFSLGYYLQLPFYTFSSQTWWVNLYATVDANNIYVYQKTVAYGGGTAFGGYDIRYYLFRNKANR